MLAPLSLLLLTALSTDFGAAPTELVPFLRYVVQLRAADGLNRVVRQEGDAKYGTVYGGAPEDANIAWVAATAYRAEWSRFHRDEALRSEAFFLLDNLARIRADGRWDDGGLYAYFGLHSFAWAVLSWLETGEVDETRQAAWKAAVAAAADDAMLVLGRSLTVGDYANPEFYYLSGLAAAWKVTGVEAYRAEAARALHRYDDRLWPGGGVPYFHESSPEHGYQQMVVKSVALYYDLTADPAALDWLRGLAGYFPMVQHRSGLVTNAEVPHLKHHIYAPINPAAPAMIAILTGDGANLHAAEVATLKRADNVANRLPAWLGGNPNWYNYHHATYAAAALRFLERHALPAAVAPPPRRILFDPGYRGPRSHWDDFVAAVGTRPMNDSLAGAALAAPAEPTLPLRAAVQGVFFQVLQGDRGPTARPDQRVRADFRTVEWSPTVTVNELDGFASASCLTRLCSPYWNDQPWEPGERWPLDEVSDWSSIQHWATWRDHLIGLGALRCHADGGAAATDDRAQVRWLLAPAGKELRGGTPDGRCWEGLLDGLALRLERLGMRGDFAFGEQPEAAPLLASVTLARAAPWKQGDHLEVATDIHPEGSEGQVRFKSLTEGGAALLLEPGGRQAWLWVANLVRHWRLFELTVPAGIEVRGYKRGQELPPLAEPVATMPLNGAQSGVWRLEAAAPLDADQVLASLVAGQGRGEARRER